MSCECYLPQTKDVLVCHCTLCWHNCFGYLTYEIYVVKLELFIRAAVSSSYATHLCIRGLYTCQVSLVSVEDWA